MHQFCVAEALPCLFANVDLPVDSESDADDIYFSKGVLLEAQLIAYDLRVRAPKSKVLRIVQVFRTADVGREAAKALTAALAAAPDTSNFAYCIFATL